MRIVFLATLLLPSAGCAVERDLDWTYEIPDGVERPGISRLVARIREGGCRDGDRIIYQVVDPEFSADRFPPVLVQGQGYCFQVLLEDGDCARYAAAETLVEVDNTVPVHVRQTLVSLAADVTCATSCDSDEGCTQCGVGLSYCAAAGSVPPRCCPELPSQTCSEATAVTCDPLE